MNPRPFRHAFCLIGAVASAQVACSSSDSNTGAGAGAASGASASLAGSGGAPSTANGGTGTGGSALASAGSSGTGNTSLGGSGGLGGADAGGHAGSGGGAGAAAGGSGGNGGAGQAGSGVGFGADRIVVSGVRGTATPAAASVINLHNSGQASAQISALALSGVNQALFHVTSPAVLPATLAPGADLAVTVAMATTGGSLPAAPTNKDLGSVLLTGTLTATSSAGTASASVYGLVLTQVNYEPTLGQVLTTLGYSLNVGKAQTNWNPNTSMDATTLPGIETSSDEVAASHFMKAGAGNVRMQLVARFSPVGELPFGWYSTTSGCPAGCTTVGKMAKITDAQTSDKARMVYPPLAAGSATEFDPGSAAFGLWIYSDQKTQMFMEGGNMVNGDWNYSQDALNSPANVHRFKSYPLKDASGAAIAKSYLVAVEEAGNGDYQDYVFVLSNVTAVP